MVNVLLAFHVVIGDVCGLYHFFTREGLGLDNEQFIFHCLLHFWWLICLLDVCVKVIDADLMYCCLYMWLCVMWVVCLICIVVKEYKMDNKGHRYVDC